MAFKLHFLTLWCWFVNSELGSVTILIDYWMMMMPWWSPYLRVANVTEQWYQQVALTRDCGEFCINISHPLLCFNSICPLHSQPCAQLTNQISVFDHVISNWPITIKQSVCQNCLSTFQLSNNGDKIDVENCISESEANSVLFLSPLVDICQWFPIICLKYEG